MPPLEGDSQNTTPSIAHRIESHPYLAVSIVVIILIAIGLIVILQRLSVNPSHSGNVWGTLGKVQLGSGPGTRVSPLQTGQTIPKGTSTDTLNIPLPTYPITPIGDVVSDDALADLLTQLSTTTSASAISNNSDAYSLIPTGLISLTTPGPRDTKDQAAIRTYGNAAGTLVQSFESMHSNASYTLKDHAEDRSDELKTRLVADLGMEYEFLGKELALVADVPSTLRAAHLAYAQSYQKVGKQLQSIAQSTSDEAYLKAIEGYNASVEELSKKFVALVTLFDVYKVRFTATEPGSVFMFSGNASSSL